MSMNFSMKIDKKIINPFFIFMRKLNLSKKRLKKGFSLHFLKKFIICPGSVVAYHASLSSSRLGSESRPGRYNNLKKRVEKTINYIFICKNILVLFLLYFLILNFLIIFSPDICAQEIISVGPGGPPSYDFGNINDAIESANESDIINVYNGIYTENIVINKSISLNGESDKNTIIVSAINNKNTIEVSANYVNISGFTIRNLGESFSCVKLNSINNCKISNCNIKNGGNGIYLIISDSNTIKDNTIESNNIGLYLWNSNSNFIVNNKIQNNHANGVFISSISSNNIIYLNDFSGNPDSNARDNGNNNWDYNPQGNYWDDYNDYDSNKDGIGDNPYIIDGNGGNKDNYPLGYFLNLNYKPVISIDFIDSNAASNNQIVSGIIIISGTANDFDGSVKLVEIKIDNGNWQTAVGTDSWSKSINTNTVSNGQHTISARSKDNDGYYSDVYSIIVNVQNGEDNQPPTVEITHPSNQQLLSGIVTIAGNAYDSDGFVILVEIKIDNTDWQICSGTNSWNFIWDTTDVSNGQHTIYVRCKDDKEQLSFQVSKIFTVFQNTSTINNPPVANANGPYYGSINQVVIFNGSLSFDPNVNDNIYYYWDFGDGTTGEGKIVEHVYNTSGNYTVELTVIDEYNLQSKDSTYVIINIKTDDKKNESENKFTPGFELIILIITILFIIILRKINNKKRRF